MRLVRNLIGCSVLLLMGFSAAMAQSVQTDYDYTFPLAKLRTFSFIQQQRGAQDPLAASPINDRRKAIAEKKFKEFRETVQQLGDLARAYGNLPADQMQHFMAIAVITPELSGEQKLLRAEGHDVFQNGDTMFVWLDAVTRKQRRVEVQASYDRKPVRIVSEFRDLPQGGPTYLATSQIAYDDGEVVIVTTNFDHERLRAETASAVPAAPEKASLLQSALQSRARQRSEAIALDRLLAEMAANDAERASLSVGYNVNNRRGFSSAPDRQSWF